jgi:membrane protein
MIALVFLYWLAAMFLFGGEINGVIIAARRRRLHKLKDVRTENVVAAP